jgi:hypothetical protein
VKVCQLPIQLARMIQSASPFPPAIFANVGLMIVVCDVYLLLSQALPRGIAVDVARKRMETQRGSSRRTNRQKFKSCLGVLDDSGLRTSCCGRSARLIRSQEHSILLCSLLDHSVFYYKKKLSSNTFIDHGRHTRTKAEGHPSLVSPTVSLSTDALHLTCMHYILLAIYRPNACIRF